MSGPAIDDAAGLGPKYIRAMRRGLKAMECPASTKVLVTDNFVEDVQRVSGDRGYDTARGATGVVAAKTLHLADGSHLIVVNAAVADTMRAARFERLLAHETGHVLINERGEVPAGVSMAPEFGEPALRALAAASLDEYRAEAAVCRRGLGSDPGVSAEDAGDTAAHLNLDVCEAVVTPEGGNDPVAFAAAILSAQNWSSVKLAYLAAAVNSGELPGGVEDLPAEHRADWDDYIAPTWEARLAAYLAVPDALEPMSATALTAAVDRLAGVERDCLRSMGFEYRIDGAEVGFYRTGADALFMDRMDRAREELARIHAADDDGAVDRV